MLTQAGIHKKVLYYFWGSSLLVPPSTVLNFGQQLSASPEAQQSEDDPRSRLAGLL